VGRPVRVHRAAHAQVHRVPDDEEIITSEIAVGFPANIFLLQSPDEILRLLHKFWKSVERTRQESTAQFRSSGVEPVDWDEFSVFLTDQENRLPALTSGQASAIHRLLEDRQDLTDAFFHPERTVRKFVSQCEDFYHTVIADMYPSHEEPGSCVTRRRGTSRN
jgi:hypothetical protein